MIVKIDELKAKVLTGIEKLGYKGEDAQIIAEVLLYAQMRGNNQGITKIATGGVPKADDVDEYKVVKTNKCGALVSGGHSMVASTRAADLAVELAAEHGVGIVASNHTYTSSGAIGYYARRISKQGYIAFVCVGNGNFSFVAPSGSAEAKFGTNPFAYAFPYEGGEVVFDNATAAMAYFGIVEAKIKGEQLPEGVGYDKDGNPSTDPEAVLSGSIGTFAGHKGFALSLFVQLLGGAFSLAGTPGVYEGDGSGTFVMAIDPGLLADKDQYMERATEMIKQVKSAKPLPGKQVVLPGEKGDAVARQAEESGEIEIADAIWEELIKFVEG
ncbi:MAG: Ldh family oxidoreductase [Candidatus Saccharibacteria bacterium]|nr:Ldh family oxidoreductase [Candidatus Saccharibacteria bacterium]